MFRFKNLIAVFAFAFVILALPTIASAQWRDRDNRRNDDDYYGNRRYNRNLQGTIQNLKNRARQFERRLDRELDRGRYDDSRREDRLNDLARQFKNATDDLEDSYDNRRDYNSSEDEARRVLQIGQQLDSALYRSRMNYNLQGEWNRIRQDLDILANAYGYNYNNRNRNNRNRRNNGDWRNNIPFPLPF